MNKTLIHFNVTLFLFTLLAGLAPKAEATPYIAYAHELPFEDFKSQSETHSLRLGYISNGMYIEAGPMTGGHGMEMGYKTTKGKWTFKTKYEGEETSQSDYFKSKIETEIIYKFGN